MSWSPIQKFELAELIASGLAEADDSVREAWERIRIEPQKWRCSPWGDDGGGFFVVAVSGDSVIWFNDIEGGFNTCSFRGRGIIDDYRSNQSDFADVLNALPQAVTAEAFARERPASEVPKEAGGAGRIVARRTTYWVLQPDRGAQLRVHFSGKREARCVAPVYEAVELFDDHPVLQEYEADWSSLFVSDVRAAPADIFERIAASVEAATHGWRGLAEYARDSHIREVLRVGHGLLMRGPSEVVRGVAEVLTGAGVTQSVVGEWRARGGAMRPLVLLLGRNFIVAESFRFEPRDQTGAVRTFNTRTSNFVQVSGLPDPPLQPK